MLITITVPFVVVSVIVGWTIAQRVGRMFGLIGHGIAIRIQIHQWMEVIVVTVTVVLVETIRIGIIVSWRRRNVRVSIETAGDGLKLIAALRGCIRNASEL